MHRLANMVLWHSSEVLETKLILNSDDQATIICKQRVRFLQPR